MILLAENHASFVPAVVVPPLELYDSTVLSRKAQDSTKRNKVLVERDLHILYSTPLVV